jgi:hypothetical protein
MTPDCSAMNTLPSGATASAVGLVKPPATLDSLKGAGNTAAPAAHANNAAPRTAISNFAMFFPLSFRGNAAFPVHNVPIIL